MATQREIRTVYAAAVAQGIVLVTFPAASTIFTDPDQYDLSNTQYGLLFVPQVVTAISASLLGAGLARRFGTKRIYLAGLAASLVSMGLLLVSTVAESGAFPLLLVVTAFLGVGFGLAVPALNTLTAVFHPESVESSVLVLNALLGLGTALAPAFVAIFVGLGFWWGLPLTSAVLLSLLVAGSLGLPLRVAQRAAAATRERPGIPNRFWVFAAFAVVYGICETVNGNWSQLDMTSKLGASTTQAALALTAFWGMVTVGRIGFALIALLPEGAAGVGHRRLRPRRARLLGAAAAHDRVREGAVRDDRRRGGGRDHRLLPARLRHCRLRDRPAARRRRRAAGGLRHGGRDRGCDGAALVCGRAAVRRNRI